MKLRSSLFSILLLVLSFLCTAQTTVLMTVDGQPVEAGEFIRMYNKSGEPGKMPSVDEYLQQFIVFKLKVADAINEGYDTTRAFKTELEGYRNQLAQNYLNDTGVKEKLLQQAYQRSLTEVNAWHVLVSIPPDASPEDTLRAWKKAIDIRERIITGEPFEIVARSASDDPSALTNGGNLGYFSVFQMITPFEDAAYRLKTGSVSQPVRTAFGYHIIKVTDRRPSKGRIRVAHIMKNSPPGTGEADAKKAENEINSVYEMLSEGASFSDLANKYSDHRESAAKGGALDWFGTGEIVNDFSEAAFAIPDTGKWTKPVRTPYGWHIIKLLDRKQPGTFEESRSFLESRINQSYLNSLSRRSFVEKLKKEYNFRINRDIFNWFVRNTDTLVIRGLRKYNRPAMPKGNVYTFAQRGLSAEDFADFIEGRGFRIETKDSVYFIDRSLEIRASNDLIGYEDSQLEKKNPGFRYLMQEFHDGILLFTISEKKIWNSTDADPASMKDYYERHKHQHLTEPGIEAKIYTLKLNGGEKQLESAFRKYSRRRNTDKLLLKKFNRKEDSTLVIVEGRWFRGDDPVVDRLKFETGAQAFMLDNYPSIINVTRIIEPEPKEFNEVWGEMMQGYQDELELKWIEQLKKKYTVKIENPVLAEVKKKLGQ